MSSSPPTDRRSGLSGSVYTIGAVIARGGQGTVLAAQRDDGLAVAIKVADDTQVSREALEREANLLAWLAERRAPGVAELLDRLDWDGRPAMVMPRYQGDANSHVEHLIRDHRGMALEAILALAVELCQVLGALHRIEIPFEDGGSGSLVHRDIKPENILVDSEGGLRLIDLGGTLVIDAFQAVRMAVFGSPMWAPYDQVLPGLPEPNPTWDTYAAAVVLFWWLSGTRPAFQADPTPMLTERGRGIWEALCQVARSPQDDRAALVEAHRALTEVREGTREVELVEVRGHAAVQVEDLAVLAEGLSRLADPDIYGEEGLELCVRDLGLVFGRALSPLSHPSPPNRYWDALALAEELETARRRLVQAREVRRSHLEREGMVARLADLDGRALPPSAVLIGQDPTSEEEGLDPLPREVRPSRASRPPPVTSTGSSGKWILGVLGGLLLFGLMSIPLIWKLATVGADKIAETPLLEDTGPRLVKSASFIVGDVWGTGAENERPTRTLALAPFRMDRTEVSNQEWRACVAAGACTPLAWMVPGSAHDPAKGKQGHLFASLTGDDQPAAGATYAQAQAYCSWKGGRLPSEEEWELAASWGPKAKVEKDKRPLPWGSAAPNCTRVNAALCARNTTLAVDALEDGASAWGLLNMAGNVWEWTASRYPMKGEKKGLLGRVKAAPEHYVSRGGAFDTPEASLRTTFRHHLAPTTVSPNQGLRCVYDEG